MKRVIILIIDSMGIGAAPDAAAYGDEVANTLHSISKSEYFNVPNMKKMGLYNIDGVNIGEKENTPTGSFARLHELSAGKDTTTGHWELAGVISKQAMPTYPDGFPDEVIDEFEKRTGRKAICNKPYSGTVVIEDYGKQHMETGDLIVYTSADSVFQIAAHEDVVPVETLYEYCRIARELLQGEHAVGRVIARPFEGKPGSFKRTPRRHDFSLEPTGETMMDALKEAGFDVLSVGKIHDIFAGRGDTDYITTAGNPDGLEKTLAWMDRDFNGLMFVNLVDTDMIYGHRNDVDGYAKAVSQIDEKLSEIMAKMTDEDILMISADHGCDPGMTTSTDHSREYVPLIMYGKPVEAGGNFGTVDGFNCVAATVLKYFGIDKTLGGKALI